MILITIASWGVNKSMSSDAGLSDLAMANVEALADRENGGGNGMANTCCPIWNVTVEVGGIIGFPKITCETGGTYKCIDCDCPDDDNK